MNDTIDEQIFKLIDEVVDAACDYEQGEDVDLDAKTNQAYHKSKALIAKAVVEARMNTLKDLLVKNENQCVCQLADEEVCDHNWSLCNVVKDRLAELQQLDTDKEVV